MLKGTIGRLTYESSAMTLIEPEFRSERFALPFDCAQRVVASVRSYDMQGYLFNKPAAAACERLVRANASLARDTMLAARHAVDQFESRRSVPCEAGVS